MHWIHSGLPEWHVRLSPLTDVYGRTKHVNPTRKASVQYAGGLSATYYSLTADTQEMRKPLFSTPCTHGRPCDETVDFSLAGQGTQAPVKGYGGGKRGMCSTST